MNYRHSYHAGSFSDVFKHIILALIIDTLKVKEAPFTYLDTHAGRGLYWLDESEAQKKQEYRFG
ncbi:MAG: 23S rRNA (adenine(2030)-N(6))-methyltransferase RlmJ, partial [Gammaproteobacteria bacterium]|nr:23S rRNA (adenine(2030)-N(6))-methyltransferase RlmJ [Gammaproteobacteria bacterium]